VHTELALTVILAAVVVLLVAAQLTRVPYPILLVLGGLALGLAPAFPEVELDPEVVLVVLLPPLLYSAAFFTPLRELRRNLRPISLLAVGLVLVTMAAVAVAARVFLDFGWAEAFVLGAIVAPTDPVAATAIANRLGVPQRVVTIVEGESLINDGTALVAFRFAVAAVVTGSFSLLDASTEFVLSVAGGIGVGIAVGALVAAVRRRLDNPPVEVTIALFTAYFAYLPAELIGVSGILAAVTVGIYMGRLTSQLTSATTRLQGQAVWEIVTFLLNSALFVLVGLQLPAILDGISGIDRTNLLWQGALVAGVVMVTRILFVFPLTYLPPLFSRKIRERDPDPSWPQTAIVSWTGMRGAVSLAAALAIPLQTDAGEPFPERNVIIFLAFSVILATLLVQGLTLPALIRALGVDDRDEVREREELHARKRAAEAALARLEELLEEEWVREETAERVRGLYDYRLRRFGAQLAERDGGDEDGRSAEIELRSSDYQRLVRELIEAQRSMLLTLRERQKLDDSTLRRIVTELDLEETRLEG
jgi:Na+/H+ antiporter